MPDETDAKILTASPWKTGGDHRDARLWMKNVYEATDVAQNCPLLHLALRTPSGACQKRRTSEALDLPWIWKKILLCHSEQANMVHSDKKSFSYNYVHRY